MGVPKFDDKGRRILLEMRGVDKHFPGVKALSNVNFTLLEGEVHVLMGENGAGKSTLIKILTGAHQPTKGEIYMDGELVHIKNPIDAQKLGIGVVYQEFNLIQHLSVQENIFLGKELTTGKKGNGFLALKEMKKRSEELLHEAGIDIDVERPVSEYGTAVQQMIEISKALLEDVKILILDEPSAVLTDAEIDRLMDTIKTLTAKGVAIIYISHRLEEIERIGNRATILRDGE